MNFRSVGAREANQQFSSLLAATEERGETIVITRRGRPVARLVPEPASDADAETKSARIAAMLERLARPMSGERIDRDALYEREAPEIDA